jgi:hypothetical protein
VRVDLPSHFTYLLFLGPQQGSSNFTYLLFLEPQQGPSILPLTISDVLISIPASESGSSITMTSANQFNKQAVFEGYILSSLHRVKEYHEFVFTDMPPS